MGIGMRWHLAVLAVALAVGELSAEQGVKLLDSGEKLGETVQVHMKTTAKTKDGVTRMWTKMDNSVPPAGTVTYKTITDVEPHGKCRFACYQDKMCGGYGYVPASHKCHLYSAPNFMTQKAENDAWHKEVSYDHTGADYEPDKAVEKEEGNLKAGLKQFPKKKPSAKDPPKKQGDDGHLFLDLKRQMNDQLETDQIENEGAKNGDLVDDATLNHLKSIKVKLYQEFYEKYAHEYEHRAEECAVRKAQKIADKRISMHDLVHPENKMKEYEKHKLYLQARKEVDNHCVREFQRKFVQRLGEWGQEKMYEAQENMKNAQDQAEMADQEAQLDDEKKAEAAAVDGKAPKK